MSLYKNIVDGARRNYSLNPFNKVCVRGDFSHLENLSFAFMKDSFFADKTIEFSLVYFDGEEVRQNIDGFNHVYYKNQGQFLSEEKSGSYKVDFNLIKELLK